MSENTELANLLAQHEDCAFSASGVLVCSCGAAMQPNEVMDDLSNLATHQADILANAGYSKPRTITTVEELDAAIADTFEDGGHLIVSDKRNRPWIIWSDEDGDECVDSWPQEEDPELLTLSDIALPVTVLHEATL